MQVGSKFYFCQIVIKIKGFNVHYRHPSEKLFLPGHSLFLSSRLTPILSIQNVKEMYLGEPYTPCIPRNTTINGEQYEESRCIYEVK